MLGNKVSCYIVYLPILFLFYFLGIVKYTVNVEIMYQKVISIKCEEQIVTWIIHIRIIQHFDTINQILEYSLFFIIINL